MSRRGRIPNSKDRILYLDTGRTGQTKCNGWPMSSNEHGPQQTKRTEVLRVNDLTALEIYP